MSRRIVTHTTAGLALACVCLHPMSASAQTHQLAELSTSDIRALDRSKPVVVSPAGIVEQHDHFLPSFTDGDVNDWLAMKLAETIVACQAWQVALLPTIPLGMGSPEGFAARPAFSGSYTVRPSTMRAVFMIWRMHLEPMVFDGSSFSIGTVHPRTTGPSGLDPSRWTS